jgi:FHA domain/Domain of unknown function (DUF1707)
MATADAPTPLPGRASDADRRRVARLLQEGSTDGRLSRETFAARVERAFTARSQAELDDLLADVRQPGPLRKAAVAVVTWVSRLSADIEAAWQTGRMPVLALPEHPRPTTIGRSLDCDCVITEPSVSRRHASLRRVGERWLLRDLGSSNGTRVNGMRVTEEVEVRPGDQLNLGGVRFRAACRAR